MVACTEGRRFTPHCICFAVEDDVPLLPALGDYLWKEGHGSWRVDVMEQAPAMHSRCQEDSVECTLALIDGLLKTHMHSGISAIHMLNCCDMEMERALDL